MSTMRKLHGYRRDPTDPRDYAFESLPAALRAAAPNADHELTIVTPIGDQGQLGSCVGNAVADAMEIMAGTSEQLSRLFVYYNSRKSHGEEHADSGTFPRNALASLKSLGICRESTWKYDESRFAEQPGPEAYVEARDRLDVAYYRATTVDQIALAIRANHPVVIGGDVGTAFENAGPNDVLDVPTDSLGGHCTLLVGVRTVHGVEQFKLRNSWSTAWGNQGYAWVTNAFVRAVVQDAWVVAHGAASGPQTQPSER